MEGRSAKGYTRNKRMQGMEILYEHAKLGASMPNKLGLRSLEIYLS